MNDKQTFLDGIRTNPEDLNLRLVYADWLEEQGDSRSGYLRADVEVHQLLRSADFDFQCRKRSKLKRLGKAHDAEWVALFDAIRPEIFACRVCHKAIFGEEAIDIDPRTQRKLKSTHYCKLCYEDVVRLQFRQGFGSSERKDSESSYHGRKEEEED